MSVIAKLVDLLIDYSIRDLRLRHSQVAYFFFLLRLFWVPLTLLALITITLLLVPQSSELLFSHFESKRGINQLISVMSLMFLYCVVSYAYCLEELSIFEEENPDDRYSKAIVGDASLMKWGPVFIAAMPMIVLLCMLAKPLQVMKSAPHHHSGALWISAWPLLSFLMAAAIFIVERKIASLRRLGLRRVKKARRFVTLVMFPVAQDRRAVLSDRQVLQAAGSPTQPPAGT